MYLPSHFIFMLMLVQHFSRTSRFAWLRSHLFHMGEFSKTQAISCSISIFWVNFDLGRERIQRMYMKGCKRRVAFRFWTSEVTISTWPESVHWLICLGSTKCSW